MTEFEKRVKEVVGADLDEIRARFLPGSSTGSGGVEFDPSIFISWGLNGLKSEVEDIRQDMAELMDDIQDEESKPLKELYNLMLNFYDNLENDGDVYNLLPELMKEIHQLGLKYNIPEWMVPPVKKPWWKKAAEGISAFNKEVNTATENMKNLGHTIESIVKSYVDVQRLKLEKSMNNFKIWVQPLLNGIQHLLQMILNRLRFKELEELMLKLENEVQQVARDLGYEGNTIRESVNDVIDMLQMTQPSQTSGKILKMENDIEAIKSMLDSIWRKL